MNATKPSERSGSRRRIRKAGRHRETGKSWEGSIVDSSELCSELRCGLARNVVISGAIGTPLALVRNSVVLRPPKHTGPRWREHRASVSGPRSLDYSSSGG